MMRVKNFLSYLMVILITVILLELSAYLLFHSLTGKDFYYSKIEKERLQRMAEIYNQLAGNQTIKTLYRFHPYFGYMGKPGAYPWESYPLAFNNYGLLSNHPYPYKKQPGDFVIAVLGGSVAEIFANIAEKPLNEYIKNELKYNNINLVLINLATGGYKKPQQIFYLQYALLSGFEFDAVLNIDGFNEMVLAYQNMISGINPLFPSGHHLGLMSQISSNDIPNQEIIYLMYNYYRLYERESKLLNLIQCFKYSIFFNLVGELWTKNTLQKISWIKYELTKKAEKTVSNEFRGPSFMVTPKDYSQMINTWQKGSEMLYAISQHYHLLYIHVLQPNQYVAGSKPLSANEQKIAINPNHEWGIIAKESYPLLIARGKIMKEKGFPFYDLTLVFKEITQDLYTDDCCHFGEQGNFIMGKEIINIFLQEWANKSKKETP